jgi:hypothetical protein
MKIFSTIVLLVGFSAVMAQPAVQSGSFQFIGAANTTVTLTLDGPQQFQETLSGSLILSNLLPGDYRLTIAVPQRGRTQQFNQQVRIEPGRRVSLDFTKSGRPTAIQPDRNAIPLCYQPQRPVENLDIQRIVSAIKGENFDSDRLKVLEVHAEYYPRFTTAQVEQIARLFTNDDGKLNCVKYLMPKVMDEENLPLLTNLFTFTSSKNSYMDYLKKWQKSRR